MCRLRVCLVAFADNRDPRERGRARGACGKNPYDVKGLPVCLQSAPRRRSSRSAAAIRDFGA